MPSKHDAAALAGSCVARGSRSKTLDGHSVTASISKAARKASPWASLACVPVLLMTMLAWWSHFVVLASPSITFTVDQYKVAVLQAMGCAGLAVLLSLLIWRRASAFSRGALVLCVLVNLYTLFDLGGQKLPAVLGW